MADSNRRFKVGLSAPTGPYFPEGEKLEIRNFPSEVGPVDLTFQTHRIHYEGFANPLRVGLWIDVQGEAPSLSDAVETFGNVARGMTAIVSLAANAAIDDPTADVAMEITPTADLREYWERYSADYEFPSGVGRWIRPMLVETLIRSYATYPVTQQDRFLRAIIQYHHAIQNWVPGSEIASLSHVWIGVEAITKLVRDKRMTELGLTAHQLREHYARALSQEQGHTVPLNTLNALDGELRRRYIFQGNTAVYEFAKSASDAYEHSFSPLWEVRDQALQSLEQAAGYLRATILDLANIDSRAKNDFFNPYYLMPLDAGLRLTIEGELRGSSDELSEIEDYPYIEWENLPIQRGVDEQGDAEIGYDARVISANVPGTVKFQPTGFGIFASPAVAREYGIVASSHRAEIEGGAMPAIATPTQEHGREVAGYHIRDLFDQMIRTDGQGIFSFDPQSEFRIETVAASAMVDPDSLLTSMEGLKERRTGEGWELLCALPKSNQTQVSLVFRRRLPVTPPDWQPLPNSKDASLTETAPE